MEDLKEIVKVIDKLNLNNIKIYSLEGSSPLFDYVVIATQLNDRQSNGVIRDLREASSLGKAFEIKGIEASDLSWTLIDCHNIIIHIFDSNTRAYYGLDNIYSILKQINVEDLLNV